MEARLFLGALLCAGLPPAWSPRGASAKTPVGDDFPIHSPSNAAGPWREDSLGAAMQESGMTVHNASAATVSLPQNRRLHSMKCGSSSSFACFNGGECVYRELCNCSRFNASGPRCQTVYNTGAERDHICRTWGQYHFETFDGLYYYFSGKSTYALVRQTELDEQSFSIQVNNDPECLSSPYSCKRSVSLFFSGDEQIKMSSEVTYKGFGLQLPSVIGNLHIQKLAGYFLVRHQHAFTLAWDGISAVYIKMAPEYLGKTHGLCGNNNAVLQDDLETSYGKLTDDITEFVESWQENPPQGQPTWDNSFLNEPPCLTQSHESLQRAYALCNILLHPPFEQCHEYVSPLPFMASCTSDLCMSAVDNATWCRALTEYARACAQAGKPLHGWRRHFQPCVITCLEPLTYNECINCCPASCHQQSQCIDSELPCIDGCYCPDGLIYENELCVKPMDCPCDYHGSSFEIGSVVYEECNNCTCIGGKWICTNLTCPAECSVSGDIHFMTFDGREYTFQATCQYILAKSRTSGEFTVSLQNAPCGQNQDGSCIQSISIILKQDPKRQVTLTHSGDVLIYDQYKINLPYADDLFEIRKLSSVFLQVKTHIGLQILYDREGLRLYLQADGRWKDDTVGLCGTFNGNMEDDFLSPVGVTESTPQLFGNAWKTLSACILVHDSSQMDPCDIHLQSASYAAEACSILTKDVFAPCYPYLSPIPYFEQCRKDTCKCGQNCFCSALAHYAHHCKRFGIVIDFRRSVPDCALSCEDTKEYSTCVSTCGRTCQALSVPETCSSDCVEGCACPFGMYLDSKTERCVERNECPCYFQGIDYPPGDNVITSLGKCHCSNGVMHCDNNIIAQHCPVGQIYINCSNPKVDAELSRERTCENQLLNLTFSAHLPCVSGCVCPPGLVKHGDVCLETDECPCLWKGKEYFPGDKVISSCHTCICQHGSFQCTFHPCPSMCTAYGDRHYRTFDGLTYDFVGTCKAYLVKSTSASFSVVIQNINCFNTGIICRKDIFINVGKSSLIFDDETGNPVSVSLEHGKKSSTSYMDKLQKIQLWKAGFFTVVHFPDEHITILWDQRTTVHVQMGHQWQGELSGLCGNFDLKTINELRTPDNFELTNSQEFGNSWTAVECIDRSDIQNPCILNPLREPFAKKECGILFSEAFEACHPVIDVTWFYSNCLADTCGCNQGGDCECFCTSVSAYAHQCCQHGVSVDWRTPRVCPYDCEYFNKALGKGPYKLLSYVNGEFVMAAKLVNGFVFAVREDDIVPGHVVSFMLTSGLYKPKAHDSNLVSFEAAERPNYFLQLSSSNTLVLSKWEKSEEFHNKSTFVIHKNTWLSGYSSFESFAKPGYFIHISMSSVKLLKYHHSEEFRLSVLLKLVDVKFLSRSACEWHYDACASPCFKTCRDPLGKNCQTVPKVEGCIPACPLNMLLDEVTQRCVYFEDCIEPADGTSPLPASIQTPAVSHLTFSTTLAAISEVTSFPLRATTDMKTTLASKLKLPATTEKTKFSAVTSNTTLLAITLSYLSSQPREMTSAERRTTTLPEIAKSNVSLSSLADVSLLFPSPVTSETSTKIQMISSGSTKLLRATEPLIVTASHTASRSPELEGQPVSTFIFTGTPITFKTTELPVKTKMMEISEIATIALPTKEAQVKPEGLATFTPSSFESRTEKTTVYQPKDFTLSPLGVRSYTSSTNVTSTSEMTKTSIGQSSTTVPNVTVTSSSPVITTLFLLKPVSSEMTKTAVVLTEQSTKTVLSPASTLPSSLGKAITELPLEKVHHLTDAVGVPFSTTLGPKMTTLQTTLLPFTTEEKETPEVTPHVQHTSSSHFLPYSLHPSSTVGKPISLSTGRPSESVPTPATPALTELKKTFKTVSTTAHPSYTVLNSTEFLTTLYTKYPVLPQTTTMPPLFVKVTSEITSPFESETKSTGKAFTDYESPLVLSTGKRSTSVYSGSIATSAMKTFISSKETATLPSISTKRESAQTMSFTGSPHILLSASETTLLPAQPDESKEERTTSISTTKTSVFPSSPSSSLISLNISLPSLSIYGKEASVTPLSPVHTSHAVLPVTKSFHTFSTSQHLEDQSVSSTSLTQSILKVTTTPKYPVVETKVVPTASQSTVESITIMVKPATAAAQTSLIPSTGDKVPVQTTKAMTVSHLPPTMVMELAHQTSKPSLTSKSSISTYQHPEETLTKSTDQPRILLSTTEATVESTLSSSLTTSLPKGIHSNVLSISLDPTRVILPTEKELILSDSVTQPYVPRTTVFQSTFPARKTADVIFGTSILPSSPELLATSSSSVTIEKDAFPFISTDTGLKSTWQAPVTESLVSSQTPKTTTTSSVLLPETTEIPIVMESEPSIGAFLTRVISTASTSVVKTTTEKTVVLPKQDILSTTAYSSTFLATTVLPATAHSSHVSSGSTIRGTGQSITVPSATSDKTETLTKSTTTLVKPTYFSVSSKSKELMFPDTEKSEELDVQPVHAQGVAITSEIPQKFYSPYFTTTTAAPSNVSILIPFTIHSSSETKPFSSVAAASLATQTSKHGITSEVQTPSESLLLTVPDYLNDTTAPSVSSFAYLSTKPLYGLPTTIADGLATAEAMPGVTQPASVFPTETAALQTCTNNSNSTSLCLAMLNLTYVSNQIIINRLSRKITVNSRFAWPTVRKYGYKVEDSGFMYAVETPTKIKIQWFHYTGVMIIEFNTTREPKALGLCGFCDRSLENDLMLPNRTVLSKSDASSTFIDSWQVPDTLKYVGEDRHQEANCSVMDCSECLRLVLNQTFSSCHPYVPPEIFCDIWVQDTEYIQNPCVSLAAYVAMCNKFNICIEWRSNDYCPFACSENFSYQACIAACEVAESCQNNEVAALDSDTCLVLTEGCVCAGGTILHRAHTAVCIPEEKCACTDSSGAPHAIGDIWKTSLSGCCVEKCVDTETIIPVEYDCSDSHNFDCQRFAEVVLLVPGDQTCCPQKICICNQSLCEPLIPECNGLEKLVTYYNEESCCPNYVCECDPAKCEPMEHMPSCQEDQTLIAARVESTCCISYICACGACSDKIPKCQEGEVLIVDDNTTERCCPTYQCICEIHRCPEFKCMLGMSLVEVWSPEKCCPFRTCECSCETIPKPQCKLGQKLQIDEQFQNSSENICNCVKYKCVRDKVCLSNERGVLLPGQTIVEHSLDGICHISYCTNVIDPSTKYYRINTSSVACAVKCKANQVYQPPKDLTTCCGSCKNISCLHTFSNGTVSNFKPGSTWISNCMRYECINTAIGSVLVASSVGCPPFNETECVKVGGYVVPFLEGCCKTCKEDGKFCKKVTVRMTIRKNDCRSNTPVNIVSCDGKCPSASIYNYNINTYARFCKCCRELGLQRRTVQLYCTSNSTWVSYSIQEPTDCSCQWS
ncbi:otogelin isoform X4 [Lagopus muta]|uniref:otogelin isoform X4 n=1 Tax=Lagopus muta TaxID=64668 RepID=UPI00209E2DEC|nr:otogelin isoform X4 [Lagopus muta]